MKRFTPPRLIEFNEMRPLRESPFLSITVQQTYRNSVDNNDDDEDFREAYFGPAETQRSLRHCVLPMNEDVANRAIAKRLFFSSSSPFTGHTDDDDNDCRRDAISRRPSRRFPTVPPQSPVVRRAAFLAEGDR